MDLNRLQWNEIVQIGIEYNDWNRIEWGCVEWNGFEQSGIEYNEVELYRLEWN